MRGGEVGGGGGKRGVVSDGDLLGWIQGNSEVWALEDGALVRWKCVDCDAQKHG